jgi:hypothetical protein
MITGIHPRFHGGIAAPRGRERQAVAIAPAADPSGTVREFLERTLRARAPEVLEARGRDERLREPLGARHLRADGPASGAFPPAARATRRPHAFAERGKFARAGHHVRTAFGEFLDRQQHPEERHPLREAHGAVDRVDDPAIAASSRFFAVLLAHQPVVGESLPDGLAHERLAAAIRLRHRTLVRLALDLELGALEPAEHECAGSFGDGAHRDGPRPQFRRQCLHRVVHPGEAIGGFSVDRARQRISPEKPEPVFARFACFRRAICCMCAHLD